MHGNRGQVEYLAEEETKKQKQQEQGVVRQLWDRVWLRRTRRKVGQNGVNVVWGDGGDAGSRKDHLSAVDLSDGFDYQTVLDLDHNQKLELTFYGYRESALKAILYYLVLLLSCGFMALVFHWNQHWALFVRRKRCALREAHFMLIVEKYKHTEASQHDAAISGAMQTKEEEEEHEVYFVETVHRVGVDQAKDQFLAERRRGVEKLAEKEPHSSDEAVKEKWFERFLKSACLFEKAEFEVKPKREKKGDVEAKMSKSPDTATTLIIDDNEQTMAGGGGDATKEEVRKTEEIKIHEHFLKFPHFSVHFDNGVFEGKESEFIGW